MNNLWDQISQFVRSKSLLFVIGWGGGATVVVGLVWALLKRAGVTNLQGQQRSRLDPPTRYKDEGHIENFDTKSTEESFDQVLNAFRDEQHTSHEKILADLKVISSRANNKVLTPHIYETVGPRLLDLLEKNKLQDSEITVEVTHILASCFHDATAREAFPEEKLVYFIEALSNSNENVVFSALKAIMNLACLATYEGLTRKYNGVIPIIQLIKSPTTPDRIRYQAIRTLVNLVYDHQNKQIVIKEDLVDDLVLLLRRKPDGDMASRIIRVLGFLADRTNIDTYRKVVNKEVIALISEVLRDNEASSPVVQENLLLITSVFITKIFRETSDGERDAIQATLRRWYADEPDHCVIKLLLNALTSPSSNRSSSNGVLNSLLALLNLSTGAGSDRVIAAIRSSTLFPNIAQCAETSGIDKIKSKAKILAEKVQQES